MKNLKLLTNPLNDENPITVQVLGICSALAVTVQMKPAIVMALSVTIVTAFSNLIISPWTEYHSTKDQDHCPAGGGCLPGDRGRSDPESLCI